MLVLTQKLALTPITKLCGRIVLLFVPPSGFVLLETMLQFVSSSGFNPHRTTCFPNMNGLSTWALTTKSLTAIFRIKFFGKVYEREIFLTTQNEPSLYCMEEVKLPILLVTFVTAEFGIGYRASQ